MSSNSTPYEFFDHTADIGVHVYGTTLVELFRNAALAMYEAMGRLVKGEERRVKSVRLEAATIEDLLHDWLGELLYEIEAKHVLYDQMESLTVCESTVTGDRIWGTAARMPLPHGRYNQASAVVRLISRDPRPTKKSKRSPTTNSGSNSFPTPSGVPR